MERGEIGISEKEIECFSKLREYKIQTIEEILNLISVKINIEDSIVRLIVFYLINHRHKYSKVAEYINKKAINDEQFVSFILSNVDKLIKYCKGYSNRVDELIKQVIKELEIPNNQYEELNHFKLIENLEKLNDHISLEQQRIIFSQNREHSIFSGLIDEINNSTQKAQMEIDNKTKQIKDELNSSVISVLGVFSAVVMVFFGGLNVLGNILSTMNEACILRVTFIAALTGIIVFNIIFLLLYFIAKLLNKSIAINDLSLLYGKCYEWDSNQEKVVENSSALKKYRKIINSPFRRLRVRYPILFWFNFGMILIMLNCAMIWFTNGAEYSFPNQVFIEQQKENKDTKQEGVKIEEEKVIRGNEVRTLLGL